MSQIVRSDFTGRQESIRRLWSSVFYPLPFRYGRNPVLGMARLPKIPTHEVTVPRLAALRTLRLEAAQFAYDVVVTLSVAHHSISIRML